MRCVALLVNFGNITLIAAEPVPTGHRTDVTKTDKYSRFDANKKSGDAWCYDLFK